MAAKSILGNGYNYQDLFDTYDALASGKQKDVNVGSTYKKTSGGWNNWQNRTTESTTPLMANAENIGSLLGKTEELEAYKTRKKQQTNLQSQGVGRSQSILGGSLV
jgi:hypothetical protein